MKNAPLLLTLAVALILSLAAQAHPTIAGRVKSYSNGMLVLELEDKSLKKFVITDKTTVKFRGATQVGALPVGAKVSVEVLGSVVANPVKAGKIVDWANSSEIVAVGAKSPYYTAVGQYASTSGSSGVPDGAPVGQHAASHTMAAVAHGGAINTPTPENHSVAPAPYQPTHGPASMGQSSSVSYPNQGASMTAPLEMMNINPYGGGTPAAPSPYPASAPGMLGNDGSGAMGAMDPSLGMNHMMQQGMDPSMMAMPGGDPSLGMAAPYASTQLGMGQSTHLMGISGDDDGDYSASDDMMGLGQSSAYGGQNKLTGSVLQVDMQRGFFVIQPFTNPQPQTVLMGPGSSAPPDLLIPGRMVEVTGRPTPQGFQASDVRAASGF